MRFENGSDAHIPINGKMTLIAIEDYDEAEIVKLMAMRMQRSVPQEVSTSLNYVIFRVG